MNDCKTTCPYCGVGCGVATTSAPFIGNVDHQDGNLISVAGDNDHPANYGRLCVKGSALAETLSSKERLLYPQLNGQRIDWDTALNTVANRLRDTRERYGPESIAFYLSGQLLTEDYYVANKLMKGFLGSANVDTNSRLCMSSAVAAYNRAFGEDVVPCHYSDLETCDLLVMVGSNAAWTHPVLYQRIAAAKAENPNRHIVVIDTRRTATCDIADDILRINPGSDSALFGGLLKFLSQNEALNTSYIAEHTQGFDEALVAVEALDVASVCKTTGLSSQALTQFYQRFARTEKTVTFYSQGINQSAKGTDNCNAIINCHLATGRIGRDGMGPFSITGQPNAMGGREVGGLANQLAAHRAFEADDVDAVARFWQATDMADAPGLKAVDLFQAARKGDIRFLWIMATNPVVSVTDSAMVTEALKRCDFVVVSDCTAQTDTAALADLLLPAAGWGEKSGTVTNSERVISRQRQLIPYPGEVKPDWWAVTEVAKRLGFDQAFDYNSPAGIFREQAKLSGFENNGDRCFDISALHTISDAQYDAMKPTRWPLSGYRPFSNGAFSTPTKRAQFVAVAAAPPLNADVPEGMMSVNSGRLRDQWHTMTRTGQVPSLARHRDFFSVSVNPFDAEAARLQAGDLARLHNSQGSVSGLVAIDDDLPRGQVWLPIHWSQAFSRSGRSNDLIAPVTDPISGQPQSKFAFARLQAPDVNCWGMMFSQRPQESLCVDYWSKISAKSGVVTRLADTGYAQAVLDKLTMTFQVNDLQEVSYCDASGGDQRRLYLKDGRLVLAVFLNKDRRQLPSRDWMMSLDSTERIASPHRLLAGCDPEREDTGAIVCSCWEVGENAIYSAIADGADSVEALGQQLRCGTRCGSCVPELRKLLKGATVDEMPSALAY